jgi:hypothetical protein
MRSALFIASFSAALALAGNAASAQEYTALDLLSPCQEADNDARWGEAAETECEQYIMGFVGALQVTGKKEEKNICAPEANTADEVRWAFMRWVHESYAKRTVMSAPEALLGALQANFPCK